MQVCSRKNNKTGRVQERTLSVLIASNPISQFTANYIAHADESHYEPPYHSHNAQPTHADHRNELAARVISRPGHKKMEDDEFDRVDWKKCFRCCNCFLNSEECPASEEGLFCETEDVSFITDKPDDLRSSNTLALLPADDELDLKNLPLQVRTHPYYVATGKWPPSGYGDAAAASDTVVPRSHLDAAQCSGPKFRDWARQQQERTKLPNHDTCSEEEDPPIIEDSDEEDDMVEKLSHSFASSCLVEERSEGSTPKPEAEEIGSREMRKNGSFERLFA